MKESDLNINLSAELEGNFELQQANNKARVEALRHYATEGFARAFDQIPLLLNVNDPLLPGYIAEPDVPCGIKYIEQQLWRLPDEEGQPIPKAVKPVVESLFLIGSSGSIGHTAGSDLDYWVCHEPGAFSPRQLSLFQQKLKTISNWAKDECDTEANFYLVNLADLAEGKVTHLDQAETEGEVAPQLLLEELYRTMLYVAGRKPLWLGVPPSTTEGSYIEAARAMASDSCSIYVDLGFPSLPAPQQMLAAALWLARKSEADPFKGLLKIITLLDYVESDFTRELLCNQVKESIFKASAEQLPVDPYLTTINRVMKFGSTVLDAGQLDLLRAAAALKVLGGGVGKTTARRSPEQTKKIILEQWAAEWNWNYAKLVHLSEHALWPERERLELGRRLMDLLAEIYIRIARYLIRNHPGRINPQEDDLAPLAARLLARFGGVEATVPVLPSEIHRGAIASRNLGLLKLKNKGWSLHSVDEAGPAPSPDNRIFSSLRAVRAAAWLIRNGLYGAACRLSILGKNKDQQPTEDSFQSLLSLLLETFPPFGPVQGELDGLWSAGSKGKTLLALNFEAPEAETDLQAADIVLRTGWGEMRHYYIDVKDLSSNADKYLKIVEAILREGVTDPALLVFQASLRMQKAAGNIKGALAAALKVKPKPLHKIRLDR